MAKKKKAKKYRSIKVIKEIAREKIGAPRPTSRVDSKKRSQVERHKPTLGRLLEEE